MSGGSAIHPAGPSLAEIIRAIVQRPVMVVKPTDRVRFTVNRLEWQRAIAGKPERQS